MSDGGRRRDPGLRRHRHLPGPADDGSRDGPRGRVGLIVSPGTDSLPKAPALVVLAAGAGSRFGGPKQLEPVGPSGEILLEYSIFDALRAGFGKVVLVVRPEDVDAFRSVLDWLSPITEVRFSEQRIDILPEGCPVPAARERPWGTGHAVLCARDQLDEPFATINADDFYGAAAFGALGRALVQRPEPGAPGVRSLASIGYPLGRVLPENGAVSRAICRTDDAGWLQEIVELLAVSRSGTGGCYTDGDGTRHELPGTTPVSMNIWGFPESVFGDLEREFRGFLEREGSSPTAECLLPDLVGSLVREGSARVRVLPGDSSWFGVTRREDRAEVVRRLGALVARGLYPEDLRAGRG